MFKKIMGTVFKIVVLTIILGLLTWVVTGLFNFFKNWFRGS